MSISKIRENAREALNGKWGKGACIVLAYLAFAMLMGFIGGIGEGIFGEESLMTTLLSIGTTIVQVPVVFGLTYSFIKLKRNEEVKAFDYVKLGFSNFGRAWKITLRTALKMILPILLVIISGILIIGGIIVYINSGAYSLAELPIMFSVGLVLYVVAMVFAVVVGLLYTLTTCIAYDNPNMTSLEVVNESARLMRGNRGKVFLLDLSFIGWAILTIFTLGIGYLWLLPYMEVALICFYEHLLGKNENNDSDSNVDAIREI